MVLMLVLKNNDATSPRQVLSKIELGHWNLELEDYETK